MAFLRQRKKLRLFLIIVVVLCLLFGIYRIQLERLVKRSEDEYKAMGYRVYSVGMNFLDEDGKNRSSGVDLGDDIGFERRLGARVSRLR